MTNTDPGITLVVGATGSIGTLAVEEALGRRLRTRALVRNSAKASAISSSAEIVVGDLTDPESLIAAVNGVGAIVFTHGSDDGDKAATEAVDYGGVRNVLAALGGATPRIALMTAIGVTYRAGSYNRSTETHDWKRRGERLVRSSGLPYTIVRPGWFDYNDADQHHLQLLQGDKRHAGNSSDGVVARRQIAQVLVESLLCDEAVGKTFELIAEMGPAQENLGPLFESLKPDRPESLDGVDDPTDMPIDQEPQRVQDDLRRFSSGGA